MILSESAARFYFPDEDPIGGPSPSFPPSFGVAGSPRVVGVVRDLKAEGLDSPATSACTSRGVCDRSGAGTGRAGVRRPAPSE